MNVSFHCVMAYSYTLIIVISRIILSEWPFRWQKTFIEQKPQCVRYSRKVLNRTKVLNMCCMKIDSMLLYQPFKSISHWWMPLCLFLPFDLNNRKKYCIKTLSNLILDPKNIELIDWKAYRIGVTISSIELFHWQMSWKWFVERMTDCPNGPFMHAKSMRKEEEEEKIVEK